MQDKILIGCPTNSRKEYCLSDYLENISNLHYSNKEVYFVDNSADENWHKENLIDKGWKCDYISPIGKQNNQYIAESHEAIRKYFLTTDCTHWLSLECDLFPESDLIEQLLCYNAPVVSAPYFIGEGIGSRLMQLEYDDSFGENGNRRVGTFEGFVNFGRSEKQKQKMYGLGCCMLTKKVAEQIQFWVTDDSEVHADCFFYLDLDFLGIHVTLHDEIIIHRNSSWAGINDYKTKAA